MGLSHRSAAPVARKSELKTEWGDYVDNTAAGTKTTLDGKKSGDARIISNDLDKIFIFLFVSLGYIGPKGKGPDVRLK